MCSNIGNASGKIGTTGTGVSLVRNGKTSNYYITSDGSLRDIVSGNKINRELSGKETVERMIATGSATFLSKSQVNDIRQRRFEERASRPDYELGNPFNERGRSKRVYRPRRTG